MPIIYCITHLLLMTLHSECLPYRTLSYLVYWCTDIFSKSYFYFINHLWKQFHVFKKVRNISRFDWDSHECATIICLYTHSEKIKTNRPLASQICIGVIIVLSIKRQSLCDILIGWELNEITPTAIGRLDILWQTLGQRISGDLLIFCGGNQIWTSADVFRCFLGVRNASAEKKLA